MRIFLTGFMGSGKTYTGRRVASDKGLPFVDLDQWIEEHSRCTINDLFDRIGEAGFRDSESRFLRKFSKVPGFVMSTGGGTPCFGDNMDWMNAHGITVFLDPEISVLVDRLSRERDHRPLLKDVRDMEAFINAKLLERRKFYELAQIHLPYDNPEADVTRLVLDKLVEYVAQ